MGQESQARRLGCFRLRSVCYLWNLWKKPPRVKLKTRLAGTLFGGQGVFYQNDEGYKSNPCQNNDIGLWHCDIVGGIRHWIMTLDIELWHCGQQLTTSDWTTRSVSDPWRHLKPNHLALDCQRGSGGFQRGSQVSLLVVVSHAFRKGVLQGWVYDVCQCFLIKHCRCVFFVNPKNILAFNRNVLFDYIRCPFDDWNQVRIDFWRKNIFVFEGWEVDTGLGHWVEDPTMRLRCHKGEEVAKEYKYKYNNKTNTNTEEGVSDIKLQFQFI